MKEEKKQLFSAFGFHSFIMPNIRISLIYSTSLHFFPFLTISRFYSTFFHISPYLLVSLHYLFDIFDVLSIIRTKEENCIKNLSQGSEGTGESISGLNSSSSCYDLRGSERWNETPISLFEASFSFLRWSVMYSLSALRCEVL